MRRRHANEFQRTPTGRLAGSGIVEDSYHDESGPGNVYRQRRPVPIAEREVKEEYPVKTYFIEVTE